MNSGKIDNQLSLALDMSNATREQTVDLDVGFNPEQDTWELIVLYTGSLDRVRDELEAKVTELTNEYAIIVIREEYISRLANYEEIIFIEMPKRLNFEVINGISASCINPLQTATYDLTGEGVIVAIIDSGIDYIHPDFRNEDGTTRILALWDQTIDGDPPPGFSQGTLYTKERINEALSSRTRPEALSIVPSIDISGHGTHVAGIACGNGRGSNGRNRGIAYKSDIIAVKLGSSIQQSFPTTAQLMMAIDFSVRAAISLRKPTAINVSFGNNYGSHSGRSLLESYINSISNIWKSNIVIGTGNEGATRTHASGTLSSNQTVDVELVVAQFEFTFNVQVWKNYYDEFDIVITDPTRRTSGPITNVLGTQRFRLGSVEIYVYFGEPKPINPLQEVYIEFIPVDEYIEAGIWMISLVSRNIIGGEYHLWLPSGGVLSAGTGFSNSTPFTTLTIPSTAVRAISVAAYDSNTNSFAYFSGRGFTVGNTIKPDIAAPGVDITSAAPNNSYTSMSGTSMATPFVTGSVALLMQWGIVRNNDPYLYGEKTKAYLIAGARRLPGFTEYPNQEIGYGVLCLRDSFPR